MMSEQHCPKSRLPLLLHDELSQEESGRVLIHLEECASCQSELETLTAEATWWSRAARGLAGVAVDGRGQLPAANQPFCSVEALLEGDQPVMSSPDASAMLEPPVHPEMLGRIDEYDVEEKIGQGGMGVVFRGFDRSLNRPVAVKVMDPHLGANAVARKRFAREAQAAAAVVHPHVVPIYRVNSTAEHPYIAMALVDGRSLQDYVWHNGPLETKDMVRVCIQIAGGLAAAHRQGLIHRDIKPANILIEKDVSRVMITDFGLARAIDDVAMTQSGCLAGTPHYMSPEQVTAAELDHRSDLFSLGSVMYFVATGREPFRAESAFGVINKIMRDVPESARSINADIPEVLNRIIERLLEKDPRDRIESAAKLEELLTQVLAHLQEPKQNNLPDVGVTTGERQRVRRRIGWGLAMAGIFAAGCWAWVGFFGPQPLNWHHGPDHSRQDSQDRHSNEHVDRHEADNTRKERDGKHND